MAFIINNTNSDSIELNYKRQNELKKPLEKVLIQVKENGAKCKVPALNVRFSSPRCMATYCQPPRKTNNGNFVLGAKEEWLWKMNLCLNDFRWLLNLSYHRFWSQIVYQKSSLEGLITFLQNAYPSYALNLLPDDEDMIEIYNEITLLAFCLVTRVSTRIESEFEWMSETKFAELLYDGFLISIPMLLDVCVIYGTSNSKEVETLIKNLISVQPCYLDDIEKCIGEIKEVFSSVENKVRCGFPCGVAKSKPEAFMVLLEDILYYVLDVSVTLAIFAEMSREAALIMHNSQLEIQIVNLYENTILTLYEHLKRACNDGPDSDLYSSCMAKLNLVRYYLLQLFRHCISAPVTILIENSHTMSDEDIKKYGDSYIAILTDCVVDQFFMNDYCKKYSLDQDLEVVAQICPELDSFKCDYLKESLCSYSNHYREQNTGHSSSGYSNGTIPSSSSSEPSDNFVLESCKPKKVEGVELESLITEVRDILPHLGYGYIQKCLEYYNYSSSAVINAVLEHSLPECILILDPELPEVATENPWAKNNLPDRVNIFDNDEFDVMTRDDIDTTRVHRGKRKDKHSDLKSMLDDKSHREELRDMYSKLGNIESLEEGYDDEYDDTYDALDVCVGEAGEAERRPIEVPRVLLQGLTPKEELDEEELPSEEEQEESVKDTFAFVENPAERRARFEKSRASKQQGKEPKEKDVVGKTKGQGQEKDVLVNRYRKGVHKSSQGNHNRRKMAQHKRQQGMFHM